MFLEWLKANYQTIALLHLLFSAYMGGIIWMVQTLQYPMLGKLPLATALSEQRFHMRTIFWLVMGPMIAELLLALAIWISQPGVLPSATAATVVFLWIWTGLSLAPIHRKLALSPNAEDYQKLVRRNWPRTVIWTLRIPIALLLCF